MTPKNGNTIEWRIGQLEKAVDSLGCKVDLIMENHLAHIREEMAALNSRVLVLSAVNFLAIVAGIIFAYIMKT